MKIGRNKTIPLSQTIVIILLLVLLFVGFQLERKFENDAKSGNEKELIENYIRNNIRSVTTKMPVLGGQWYVVSIQVDEDKKSGEVIYEDGHIQEKADFNYEIIDNNIRIKDFLSISDI